MRLLTAERRGELSARIERAAEVPLLVLAVVFLAATALPELAALPAEAEAALDVLSWGIWAVFALELTVRTYLAPDRGRYLITHWPDVLTVLLPFLRPLRVLRIIVAGARVWHQARAVGRHRTFTLVAVTGLASVWIAAALAYGVERGSGGTIQTFGDALWWAISTITTVGYGDVYPTTPLGRSIAIVLMLVGISLFGLLTARIAAFFVEDEEAKRNAAKLDEILERLERLEGRMTSEIAARDARAGPVPPPDPRPSGTDRDGVGCER